MIFFVILFPQFMYCCISISIVIMKIQLAQTYKQLLLGFLILNVYVHVIYMLVMYAHSPLWLDGLASPPWWVSSLYLQCTVIILGLQHLPCSHVGSGDPNFYFLILMQHELYNQIISLALYPHDFL